MRKDRRVAFVWVRLSKLQDPDVEQSARTTAKKNGVDAVIFSAERWPKMVNTLITEKMLKAIKRLSATAAITCKCKSREYHRRYQITIES